MSDGDRAGAADYSTRQTAQQAASAATEDSNSSSLSAITQRSKTTKSAVVPRPGLPGSPGQGGGPTLKGKSRNLKQDKGKVVVGTSTREQQSGNVVQPDGAIGKHILCCNSGNFSCSVTRRYQTRLE